MHEGEFLDALKTFEKAGGIHWADKQPDALRAMAVKTPPMMTPPLISPSALISFEKMKFWRGHFSRET
jgi:hypothetical protein